MGTDPYWRHSCRTEVLGIHIGSIWEGLLLVGGTGPHARAGEESEEEGTAEKSVID